MFSAERVSLPQLDSFILFLCFQAFFGLMVGLTYIYTTTTRAPSKGFAITLILLPSVVATTIMMIQGNLAGALSLGGAFTIIRFRSVPGNPKDILFVLFSMAIGLTSGMGFLLYAMIVTIISCAVTLLLQRFLHFGAFTRQNKILRVTVPENFNTKGAFDDILERYATNISGRRMRTTDLGSLYELTFNLTMPGNADEKAMMDEIRTRNGNLPIVLIMEPQSQYGSSF
jgi:hypothetical protein